MNAFSLSRTLIFEEFAAARAASAYPTDTEFPIAIRNRKFKRPASGPWGRISLQSGERNPNSIGGGSQNLNRSAFTLILQIFVPEHEGEAEAYAIGEALLGSLDTSQASSTASGHRVNVNFWTSSIAQVGKPSTDSDPGSAGMEQFNATISGHVDDYPAP